MCFFHLEIFAAKVTQLGIFLFNLFNYLKSPYFTAKSKLLLVKRIYKEWRLLFWILVLFMAGQLFFMAKAIENVPFFLYHMYSRDQHHVDSTAVYLVKTADGYFNHKKLSAREQEMLMNSISYYVKLKQNGDGINESVQKRFGKMVNGTRYETLLKQLSNDSSSLSTFPQWWSKYFQAVSKNKYDSVAVMRSYVYSTPPYHKSATDSLIFTVKLK